MGDWHMICELVARVVAVLVCEYFVLCLMISLCLCLAKVKEKVDE